MNKQAKPMPKTDACWCARSRIEWHTKADCRTHRDEYRMHAQRFTDAQRSIADLILS